MTGSEKLKDMCTYYSRAVGHLRKFFNPQQIKTAYMCCITL